MTPRATSLSFRVDVETDWAKAAPAWRSLVETSDATPFQRFDWLDAWYRHIAPSIDATPRLVTVRDATSDALVLALPLVSTPGRNGPMLRFADEELTDFNGPLLGALDVVPGVEPLLWRAIVAALPGHAVAELRKMPRTIAGRANPLVVLAGAHDSSVASNALSLNGTFASFHEGLDRRVRMEFERSWRVLHRERDVRFEHVRDEATALRVLALMDNYQRARLGEVGAGFSLDEPAQSAFYRDQLGTRLSNGSVVLTAIWSGDTLVAALYAIADSRTLIVLRLAHAGKDWLKASPGRLIVHKSIELCYQLGFEVCDLSVGDYDYKRRFGVTRTPLVDLVAAMSWRGRAAALRHRAVGALRARPELDARVRGLAARLKRA